VADRYAVMPRIGGRMSKSVREQGGKANRHGGDATPDRGRCLEVRDRDAAPSTCTSRSLASRRSRTRRVMRNMLSSRGILAHVTLLACANVAVLAAKCSYKALEAHVREHESTIALLYGRRHSQSPLAVPHQGALNASNQPIAMRCVDPVRRVTRHTRRMRSTMGCRRVRSAGSDPVGVGPKQMRRGR
jgi:hypothetical protein